MEKIELDMLFCIDKIELEEKAILHVLDTEAYLQECGLEVMSIEYYVYNECRPYFYGLKVVICDRYFFRTAIDEDEIDSVCFLYDGRNDNMGKFMQKGSLDEMIKVWRKLR